MLHGLYYIKTVWYWETDEEFKLLIDWHEKKKKTWNIRNTYCDSTILVEYQMIDQ